MTLRKTFRRFRMVWRRMLYRAWGVHHTSYLSKYCRLHWTSFGCSLWGHHGKLRYDWA